MSAFINKVNTVFFAGIGGIGMSALAQYFLEQKKEVYGYDRIASPVTRMLTQKGAHITYEEDLSHLHEMHFDLVIYTPAIPRDHPMLIWLENKGAKIFKRSEVLGMITEKMKTIAVAGSHGKTSVSALITQLLNKTTYDPYAFLGGIALNFESNYKAGDEWAVAEADEFDRSFLKLSPVMSVVTSIDSDHLDIYGSFKKLEKAFNEFVSRLPQDGVLIHHKKIQWKSLPQLKNVLTYAVDDHTADISVGNQEFANSKLDFSVLWKGKDAGRFQMPAIGDHNLENALAAIAIGFHLGIDIKVLRENLSAFKGVHRRFEYVLNTAQHVFIDDYAHHPAELTALLKSVRAIFPERHITIAFQPHLYSRTRDLAEAFGESLSLADDIILLDIYPAREAPIKGVDAHLIEKHIKHQNRHVISKEMLPEVIDLKPVDILITAGAGDIDKMVLPVKEVLLSKIKNLIADEN